MGMGYWSLCFEAFFLKWTMVNCIIPEALGGAMDCYGGWRFLCPEVVVLKFLVVFFFLEVLVCSRVFS